MILAPLTMLAASLVGWSDPPVTVTKSDRVHASFQRSLATLDKPSERTIETLKRYDKDRPYRKNVEATLASLEKLLRSNPDPDLVYALAELSWIEAKRLDRWRKAAALDRYMDVIAYSHDFLFAPELAQGRQPSDPRFRMAFDLYNGSLDRLVRYAQTRGRIMPDASIPLAIKGRDVPLRVVLRKSPWAPEDVDETILASDYEVTGLTSRSFYQFGVGVPMIGIHRPSEPGKSAERFYPPEMAFPLSAYLAPKSRLRETPGAGEEPTEYVLELLDPVRQREVGTAPYQLPIEADVSTPLAFMWSKTDLNRYRWNGLFRPGAAIGRANLMLLRPYEPGKVPVVMVHGLISTPLAWIPMLNELLRVPEIQTRYQFFLYMYPTGVPIPIAMAGLRETLQQAKTMYDPAGGDPAFDEMVLLGHSMGGLISHGMALESGDRFLQLYTDRRFEDLNGPPDVLAELRRYLIFEPFPSVKRVVFLGTPHRGSDMSHNVIGRVGSGLIAEVDFLSSLLTKLRKDNPDAFDPRTFRRLPTSIENLETDSPELKAMLVMRRSPGVHFHSIIGSLKPGPVESSTDGVVGYRSSHLDGVDSEILIRSGHGVQRAPLAIQEVRRILLEHAGITARPESDLLEAKGPKPVPGTEVEERR
jgi:pimeloyl-ACP methyl ester carboxylesterase